MFPEIKPYHTEHLQVSELHSLYIEQVGNPQGIPVLFLHGGPGTGCSRRHRRFFDPNIYRVILFDQRGAGRSKPFGETRENTLPLLIEDVEKIRHHLAINRWLVFGGSWGSALAIAYGIEYPEYCLGFILRGVFLMRSFELEWFLVQIQLFHPERWNSLLDELENLSGGKFPKRFTLSYHQILERMQGVLERNQPQNIEDLFVAFYRFEESIMTLLPAQPPFTPKKKMLAIGKIQHYYFFNNIRDDGVLLSKIERIHHLPCTIIQGRYDLVCPPLSAYELHHAWPGSVLNIIPDGGHSANDPSMEAALLEALEDFKTQLTTLKKPIKL